MNRIALLAFALFIATGSVVSSFAYDNITPQEAYELAATNPDVFILDVRTAEEWNWVGHPGRNRLGEGAPLTGKVVNVPWMKDVSGVLVVNPSFLADVKEIFENNPNVVLITMCRSGVRSISAAIALESSGYKAVNMLDGFEGSADSRGYRTKNGWAVLGLPYSYGAAGAYDD
jgi:rhodanese-related sulfurtransferase